LFCELGKGPKISILYLAARGNNFSISAGPKTGCTFSSTGSPIFVGNCSKPTGVTRISNLVGASKELYNVFGTDKKTFVETQSSFIDLIDEGDRAFAAETSKPTF
jgi:hypothetical protein